MTEVWLQQCPMFRWPRSQEFPNFDAKVSCLTTCLTIGGDCAEALTITESSEPEPPISQPRYEAVTKEQLALWSVGTPGAFSAVTGKNEVRLSLAGAQDMLPVHVDPCPCRSSSHSGGWHDVYRL